MDLENSWWHLRLRVVVIEGSMAEEEQHRLIVPRQAFEVGFVDFAAGFVLE